MTLDTDALEELQRFAEFGRLSAGLLHEISNPLAAASLYLDAKPNLHRVRRHLQTLQRYVEAARQQLRQESQREQFHLQSELNQVLRVLVPQARRAKVRLELDNKASYRLWGDPVKFQQIIANLVVNAIDAYSGMQTDGKRVTITLRQNGKWLVVCVRDWGCGINSQQLPHIFETFYSTKSKAGHGLGLGLAVVKQFVEQDFHGHISVSSSKRHGTCFQIKLRLTD